MCVCACMCVNDMALNTSPGGTSLPHTSMHHNASAIYKIDDQRLCRSGQNDAADIHRGTLTNNGKQREASGHCGQTERKKKNREKFSSRWTDGYGVNRSWGNEVESSQWFLMLVFLSYGTILCLLITHNVSVWFLYSCQS